MKKAIFNDQSNGEALKNCVFQFVPDYEGCKLALSTVYATGNVSLYSEYKSIMDKNPYIYTYNEVKALKDLSVITDDGTFTYSSGRGLLIRVSREMCS